MVTTILFEITGIYLMVLLESQVKLKLGDVAPSFELMGTDDIMHSIDNYKDHDGLLIIFMCNHCPYVKAKLESIKDIDKRFQDRIAVIGINSNDPIDYPDDSFDAMKQIVNEKELKFDYLVDETQEVAKKYGAMCTPDPFLFDSNHRLVFHGRIDNAMNPDDAVSEKTMIQNIERLLAGKTIEKWFEPSIGCSIKWKKN